MPPPAERVDDRHETLDRRWREPGVVLVTGVQAAGKSTLAQAVAERLPRAVHVRGDGFRRMIVSGRHDMTPDAGEEALRQLRLRYRLAAATADTYAEAGFTVVVQDIWLGADLTAMTRWVRTRPLAVVVLAPSPAIAEARDAVRHKQAYAAGYTAHDLDRGLREETDRLGLWLENGAQDVPATVAEVLARAWDEGTRGVT